MPFHGFGGPHCRKSAEAVRVTRAGGVDISFRVERAPRVKDPR